ncbi:hypothetical protein GIB67_026119, partial [Kingdonia uniflora]
WVLEFAFSRFTIICFSTISYGDSSLFIVFTIMVYGILLPFSSTNSVSISLCLVVGHEDQRLGGAERLTTSMNMSASSTQFMTSRRIVLPIHQVNMWANAFKDDNSPNTGTSTILEVDAKFDNKSEDTSHGSLGPLNNYDQEATKPPNKVSDGHDYIADWEVMSGEMMARFIPSTYEDESFVKLKTLRQGQSRSVDDYASDFCMLLSRVVLSESVAQRDLRRLAQNREAAKKSRLRKKAYVQQLETSRSKLTQIEQELQRARQQGLLVGGALDTSHLGFSGTVNSGVATFEMGYSNWIDEQDRHIRELRTALQAHVSEDELRILVDSGMRHYYDLFRMKADAAKADVFYLMSGMWKSPAERFFLWIGGFRPSELLKVLTPQLDPLSEQQIGAVYNLQVSSQQFEDALYQGMAKLQQTLAESLATDPLGAGNYRSQMATAMGKLEDLVTFVNQADQLRQQTLKQMSRILTTRQAARGLLALGDYFQRFRALSSLWAARPREPT